MRALDSVSAVCGVPVGTLMSVLYENKGVTAETAQKIGDCVLAHRRGASWPWEESNPVRFPRPDEHRAAVAEDKAWYRGGGRRYHNPACARGDKVPCACGRLMNKTSKQCRECRWPSKGKGRE